MEYAPDVKKRVEHFSALNTSGLITATVMTLTSRQKENRAEEHIQGNTGEGS
jgi:hypothetical protein